MYLCTHTTWIVVAVRTRCSGEQKHSEGLMKSLRRGAADEKARVASQLSREAHHLLHSVVLERNERVDSLLYTCCHIVFVQLYELFVNTGKQTTPGAAK